MKKPLIIALCGKKGVGKDTLYNSVAGLGFRRLSFSDQLKYICSEVFPWLYLDYPQGDKDRKQFQTSRGMLSPRDVWIAMNIITEIDENVLITRLESQLRDMIDEGHNLFVITDLRKPEEHRWVKKNGIPIIKILDYATREEDSVEKYVEHIVGDFYFENHKNEQSIVEFQKLIQEILHDYSSVHR